MNPLIFTDLDGSLLDHFSYDWQPAAALLTQLKEAHIKVIATTSKTHAEVCTLKEDIPLARSHITENGAGIFLAKEEVFNPDPTIQPYDDNYYLKAFCQGSQHWQRIVSQFQLTGGQHIRPLSQMTLDEVIASTGLTHQQAIQAKNRLFSEPTLFQGNIDDQRHFIEQLQQAQAQVLIGGRFMHVSGHCNKGMAMQWLKVFYESLYSKPFCTIAIGDGKNDIEMLEIADYALIIPSAVNQPIQLDRQKNVFVAKDFGPTGWQQGLKHILEKASLI